VTPGTARFFGLSDKRRMDNARAGALGLARDNGRMRMRKMMLAAAAALAVAACNQMGAGGPSLPAPQPGVQAPSVQTPPATPPEQIQISDQNRREVLQNINDQLTQIGANFAAGMAAPQGFADETAAMQPGTDHVWRFDLTANTQYSVVGACDADCTNVDIELIDSRGGVVASDMLPDDYPVVPFTPTENGTYYARLLMQSCTRAPCYAGMRVLTAGAAAAPK
jgi:hypothetical protein